MRVMSVASRLGIGLAALALVAAVVFVAALVASRGGGDGGREVREWMARCGPKAARPPCGPGVRLGVDYEYLLYDHCGIEWALFDDRLGVPAHGRPTQGISFPVSCASWETTAPNSGAVSSSSRSLPLPSATNHVRAPSSSGPGLP